MRKWALVLCLAALTLLTGCARNLDYIVANEPCVRGVVEEVGTETILIKVDEGEEAAASSDRISVSLNVENTDSVTHFYVGDHVAVYYDGKIAESYPAQISTVYAITLLSGGEERQAVEETG